MRIRMKVSISGPRFTGEDWPPRGGVLDVPDSEGADLCASGLAVLVPLPPAEVETATADVVEVEEREQTVVDAAAPHGLTTKTGPVRRTRRG